MTMDEHWRRRLFIMSSIRNPDVFERLTSGRSGEYGEGEAREATGILGYGNSEDGVRFFNSKGDGGFLPLRLARLATGSRVKL